MARAETTARKERRSHDLADFRIHRWQRTPRARLAFLRRGVPFLHAYRALALANSAAPRIGGRAFAGSTSERATRLDESRAAARDAPAPFRWCAVRRGRCGYRIGARNLVGAPARVALNPARHDEYV